MPIEIRRKKLRYIQETLEIAAQQVGHAYSSDRENDLNDAAAAAADALHELTKLLLSDVRRIGATKTRAAGGRKEH
jgi:hypothetical protein